MMSKEVKSLKEGVSVEEAYTVQFPETMPDVVMNPMVGFLIY
jgi:hypothetical protein